MLTRLQIEGFKNFHRFDMRFGPFTCVAGPNGVGKSNLFDAIKFLHLLTKHPIMEAVRLLRETKGRSSEPGSLFLSSGRFRAPEFRFVADLLIERDVQDDFGVSAQASISTVRYTLAFRLNRDEGAERLELAEEDLSPIKLSDARRSLGFNSSKAFRDSCVTGRRVGRFISTLPSDSGPQIKVHQEGHGGRTVPAPKSSRTVIGGMATSDFPTVLATHREMASWQTLMLEPSAMRAPSFYTDERFVDARGANLPATIERLGKDDERPGQICAELANHLSELIEDVREIRVKNDEKTETLTLEALGRDGIFHPARSLSDGTLRFLVLAVLAQDPKATGMLCLEEPENGIHPARIPAMLELLKDIAVEPQRAADRDNPLRQVVINTHAPAIIDNLVADDLVYLDEEQVGLDDGMGRVASLRVPETGWRAKLQREALRLSEGQLQPYLRRLARTRDEKERQSSFFFMRPPAVSQ